MIAEIEAFQKSEPWVVKDVYEGFERKTFAQEPGPKLLPGEAAKRDTLVQRDAKVREY